MSDAPGSEKVTPDWVSNSLSSRVRLAEAPKPLSASGRKLAWPMKLISRPDSEPLLPLTGPDRVQTSPAALGR